MTDNFKLIRNLLFFRKKGDFYFIQVIKRRKDNPGLKRDMKWITNYYIESLEYYDSHIEDIKEQCEKNNARAYIHLNVRNAEKVSLHMLGVLAGYISEGNHIAAKKAWTTSCGQCHSDPFKKWIVDIDDITQAPAIVADIFKIINDVETTPNPYFIMIPTVNGQHLITYPFNKEKFKKKWPNVDIQTENPTLLYYNKINDAKSTDIERTTD